MAAPSYLKATIGTTDAGGAWAFNPVAADWTDGSFPSAGSILIAQILQDGTTNGAVSFDGVGTNTGVTALDGTARAWTNIAGPNGDGSWPVGSAEAARQFLFIGRKDATSPSNVHVGGGNSTSEDLYLRIYAFSNVSTGTTLATVIEETTAGNATNGAGTAASVTDTAVTTLGPDRLALNFVGINDDNAISVFTGMSGGTWAEAVAEYAESSGTDAAIGLQIAYPGAVGAGIGDGGGGFQIYGAGGANEQAAQSFSVASGVTTSTIFFSSVGKNGSPTDNLVCEIQTDSSGSPSGSVVASGSVAASTVSAAGAPLGIPVTASLSAGTTYWIVLRRDGVRSTVNYCILGGSSTSTYAGGVSSHKDSGSWVGTSGDIGFSVGITTTATIDGGAFTQADGTDGWGVVGFALIGTTVVLDQQHYRFRNDDGNETTATWLADLDTDVN